MPADEDSSGPSAPPPPPPPQHDTPRIRGRSSNRMTARVIRVFDGSEERNAQDEVREGIAVGELSQRDHFAVPRPPRPTGDSSPRPSGSRAAAPPRPIGLRAAGPPRPVGPREAGPLHPPGPPPTETTETPRLTAPPPPPSPKSALENVFKKGRGCQPAAPSTNSAGWLAEFSPATRERYDKLVESQLIADDTTAEKIKAKLEDFTRQLFTQKRPPMPHEEAMFMFWESAQADRAQRRPRSPEEEHERLRDAKRRVNRDPRIRSLSAGHKVQPSTPGHSPPLTPSPTPTPTTTTCAPLPLPYSFAVATTGASRLTLNTFVHPHSPNQTLTPRAVAGTAPAARPAAHGTQTTSAPVAAPSSAGAAAPGPLPGTSAARDTSGKIPTTVQSGSNTQPSKGKFPPLVVEKLPSWSYHFKELKAKLGRAPNARPFGQGVRFSPKDSTEFRLIQSYLTNLESRERISWFTYSLPAERSERVAIRGLPADTPPQEIEEELRGLGYVPEYVRAIRARSGRPGCIFLAILRRTEGLLPGIYEHKELLCMPGIKIEAWRGKKGPAQCHRCQKFRHSSHNCHRELGCVRCGESHAAHQCTRPLEEPATCANCGGPHPANHTSCPVFKREARNKRAGTVAISAQAAERKRGPSAGPIQPAIVEEQHEGSLMAAANGPTTRGAPLKKSRRKRKGKKAKASSSAAQPAPAAHSQPKPKKAEAPAPANKEQNAGGYAEACKLQLRVLQDLTSMLQQVITAMGEGQDTGPAIRSGISTIASRYGS